MMSSKNSSAPIVLRGSNDKHSFNDPQDEVRALRQENKELIEANQELVKREAELQRKLAARGELEKAVDLEVAAIKDVLRMVQKVFKEDFAARIEGFPPEAYCFYQGVLSAIDEILTDQFYATEHFVRRADVNKGVAIRFDGPPGHESGRFVEVERDGASIRFGEWVEDGDYWLLQLDGWA